ncbi:hypothetical protein CASFOL_030169 [Castilleja foliolosa]|uniref:Flowering time control protein FCA n=1 Tax=Castilleja foliolosa TaxID=1961234 RepID=A0ABD3CCT1_9LAMI
MDKFDRHRGGDRFVNSGEEPQHNNPSGMYSRGVGSPFHHRQDNYRDSGDGRNSLTNYHGGFNGGIGGGRGSGGGGRGNHMAFDSSPSPYPPLGGDGGVRGGLRPFGDGGFRPAVGGLMNDSGGRVFPPMGGGGGVGFRPGVGDGDEFQRMGGGSIDVGRFRPTGGTVNDVGGFRPTGGALNDGGEFQVMSGDASDGGGFQPMGGGSSDGGGFRPTGGGEGDRFGLDKYHEQLPPLTGQKRGYPFSGREMSPGRDGASFAKLFVGSVPRTATEDDIRPPFDNHGCVMEVTLIKDKRTGHQQGCCFIKYATSEEADRAIRELHNQYTLPGGVGPIQVRYADGERGRLGATEFKLFVGSLNKQATEKEVEEIFSPYGRVDDVYLMRDELKQSRGCGFVKYSQREMAQAAINALNGTYTMRGCDQPLNVRFADPRRPRPGDARGSPSYGVPAFGPRFPTPTATIRPPADHDDPLRGPIPSSSWPPVSTHNLVGPASHAENQFPARPGDMVVSTTPRPLQPAQPLKASSFSNPQNFQGLYMQPGQTQTPHSVGQTPQQLPGRNGQFSVPTPSQVQHNASSGSGKVNQQPPPAQQHPQSQSHLAQMLSQQKQNLQATFQSSQQALNQLQRQVQQLQPSNQNLTAPQGVQAAAQQSIVNTSVIQPTGSLAVTTPVSATVPARTPAPATVNCNWTEHMSPDGYKYYYNSSTGESKWEKPEDLSKYEKQQQQKPSNQHPQEQASPQMQVQLRGQYPQPQLQNQPKPIQQATQTSYQVSGFSAPQVTKYQELGYAQIPAQTGPVTNPIRNQQGSEAPQEWMWKNNNQDLESSRKRVIAEFIKTVRFPLGSFFSLLS